MENQTTVVASETVLPPILTPAGPAGQISPPPSKPPYIKALVAVFILIVIAAIGAVFYIRQKTTSDMSSLDYSANSPLATAKPAQDELLRPIYMGEYDVEVRWLNSCTTGSCNGTGDIYLKDKQTGEEKYVTTADDLYIDSRAPQYENGYIFVLKRIGYDPNKPSDVAQNWTEQLWVYTQKDQGQMLFDQKGFSFQANADASMVAISESTPDSGASDKIDILYRAEEWKPKLLTIDYAKCSPQISPGGVLINSFAGWSEAKQLLWGEVSGAGDTNYCYWALDLSTSAFTCYQTDIHRLFDLNINTGLALYLDKPFQFDEISDKDWNTLHPTYSLYIYSIETKESLKIDTFPSSFTFDQATAGWASDTEFKYFSSKGAVTFTKK